MKKCFYVSLVLFLALGCLCMMPMGMMHKGHEHESQKQEVSEPSKQESQKQGISETSGHESHGRESSKLCECDCIEREGECHCRHAA